MPPNFSELVSRALDQPVRHRAVGQRRGRQRSAHISHPLDRASHLLAQPRQSVVALVVTDPASLLAGEPEWIKLVEAIAAACLAQHSLCALYLIDPEFGLPETLYTIRLDAVIVIGQPTDERVAQLRARRPATVLIEPPAKNAAHLDRS